MKDDRGIFYYPFPGNKRVRMYVQKNGNDICFRLWNTDDSELWEKHGWVPYDAICQASEMYKKKGVFDPKGAYDIKIAEVLIKEESKTP
ncbi:Uncharacterized protein dnl_52720 [Desulfonema limicola]|uniref:Uncharacterized protein n=1 Tax=Desulfonema limicola TaxID=45656 RepID=A0A975GIW1_9BACT|nr:hypothetical protein [Desulfonema limicola]QTA82886.1 Uncharacterized protein dnl_52720 [Desulfonema limicola]